MSKKKLLLLFIAATVMTAAVGGCGKDSSDKNKTTEEGESSAIPMPEGEALDEALMQEFIDANDLSALCEKYGTIQIDSSYIFMDEKGKKSNGGKSTEQYCMGENGIEWQSISDGGVSYQTGDGVSYSKYDMMDENENVSGTSYMVSYTSDSFNEMYGGSMLMGMYAGSEYAMQYCYKETSDGYEIYEGYDYGDGTGNVITYYANKDKVVTKTESVMYPGKAARYVDSTRKLKTGADVSVGQIEEFENGAVTVTVIEKASGKQTDIKMPAGTELYCTVNDDEIVTKDEAGTQLIGENRYENFMTVNENTTVYIVQSAAPEEDMGTADMEMEEGMN